MNKKLSNQLWLKPFYRPVSRRPGALARWLLPAAVLLVAAPYAARAQNAYVQHNLVSDLPGMADFTDTNLVNPWGIAISGTSPFWVSDNHSGFSTLYNSSGTPQSLIVNIPPPGGGTPPAAPTGVIFNGTTDFTVSPGAVARFIFATENGTIVGWNSGTNGAVKADNSASGAIYKGLAMGKVGSNNYLYAANFHAGTIDVFNTNFAAATLPGSFTDPALPSGFAPFNVQNLGGLLYVAYAKQDALGEDDVPGPGNGYVDIFDTSGNFMQRFISQGALNSPWAMVVAPAGFGPFSGALLIGNFGNGQINAFNAANGALLGTLKNPAGANISILGLWALVFGNGASGGDAHTLYFSAGIPGGGALEDHGLFGSITALPATIASITNQPLSVAASWFGGVSPFLVQRKARFTDTNWINVLTTSNRNTVVPKDAQAAFYRIQSQTTNTVVAFSAALEAASENPPTASSAQGVGTFSLEGSNLTWSITFSGLTGPATAAHIHAPATTTNNGPVTIPFSVPAATAGTITGSTFVTSDQASNIISGFAYANIHTAANPGGEIRGQLVPLHVPITLNGAQEVPSVTTSATASGTLTFIGSHLFYTISFSGLSSAATAAHIHGPAAPGIPGDVLIPLANPPAATSGTFSGNVALAPTNLLALLSGRTYINIHSISNANGEVRGQIWPIQLGVTLNGLAEVPTNGSPATGSGFLTITNGVMNYSFTFANLTSAATASHIHGPAAPGTPASVIIPFSGVPAATSGSFSGSTPVTGQQLIWLLNGMTYGNIHTVPFPGGEIRGQVQPNE